VLVINTHLHFDHCGGNRLFPGVPIYVQRSEREAARRPDYTIPEWVEFEGATYEELDGPAEIESERRLLDLGPRRIWITHSHEPWERR
jgi:N-acyl homoserine lactone hydrolase